MVLTDGWTDGHLGGYFLAFDPNHFEAGMMTFTDPERMFATS